MLDVIAPTSDDVVFAAGYATSCAAIATLEFLAAFHISTHHAHRLLHRTAWIFAFSAGITWLCAATTLLAERLAPVIAATFVVFAALMFTYARRIITVSTNPGPEAVAELGRQIVERYGADTAVRIRRQVRDRYLPDLED